MVSDAAHTDREREGPSRAAANASPLRDEAPARSQHDDGLEEVRGDVRSLRQEAGRVASALTSEAEHQFERAKEGTASFADEQKDAAARQMAGIATALRRTSDDLDADQPAVARHARSMAKRIDQVSSNLKNHDVDSLLGMAEDYARRQPAATLGIAALAGFISGRFLTASGRRRDAQATPKKKAPAPAGTRPSNPNSVPE